MDTTIPVFERTVTEKSAAVTTVETLTAVIGDYDVKVETEGDCATMIAIYATHGRSCGRSCVYFYPHCVGDLEAFAPDALALLTDIAAGLRAAGKDDLRSKYDREHTKLATAEKVSA